jgi:hypothetical protein
MMTSSRRSVAAFTGGVLLALLLAAPATWAAETGGIHLRVDENGKMLFTNAPPAAPQPPPRSVPPAATWREPFEKGVHALGARSFEEAVRSFRKAIEVDPEAKPPYRAIRSAYGQMGRDSLAAATDSVRLSDARKALANNQVDEARRIVGEMLDEHFANPSLHSTLAAIHERTGDREGAERAKNTFRGLLEAILATGDGRTPQTAFRVQSIAEEYLIVRSVLRCTRTKQEIHTAPSGRPYDLLTLSCEGQTRLVYFDISAFMSPDPQHRAQAYRYDAGTTPR